jgi:N-acetylglutamate synthase-like GNAT family acetyltransferase
MQSGQSLKIRRATAEDLDALKDIWSSMRLSAEDLGKRLTEFQVVESGGQVAGAIGFQIVRSAALLHSEGYSDYSVADAARNLFWERIQKLAANHGVFRLWTQENSPFWQRWGFQPADDEALARLPDEWKSSEAKWFTLELKNEAVITAALKNQFAGFMDDEKKKTAQVSAKARTISTVITIAGFAIGILGIGFAVYLFVHRNPFSQH